VGNTIVGRPVDQASDILKFGITKASDILYRCLTSAINNAEVDHSLDVDDLIVDKVFVDRGPMLKRYHPCSHGSSKPILKRTCHVTVIVGVK
jgi:large subunit ribosomal protein L22